MLSCERRAGVRQIELKGFNSWCTLRRADWVLEQIREDVMDQQFHKEQSEPGAFPLAVETELFSHHPPGNVLY